MTLDPTFKLFDISIKYAESKMNNLYDKHDGEKLSSDSSEWDIDYMNGQMVTLIGNFSKERINHLRKVHKHIYLNK